MNRCTIKGASVVALGITLLSSLASCRSSPAGPQPQDPGAISSDLAADSKLMWETEHIGGEGTGVPIEHRFASTQRAVDAASRVFNSIDLIGLSREQVMARLGDPRTSSNSIYNFPFYPAPGDDLVYRFDTGAGGWQFNIHFSSGKVSSVDRLGIE
ncbi:MAG TPA: hypothetical protein VHQ47_19680 [Phycisphaerae bacterium]|jgi:hypothetical protein|nr:hypothetical protein [Phycisphaerae bacterium]